MSSNYIKYQKAVYPQLFSDDLSVLHHLICVLGNGEDISHKYFIDDSETYFEVKDPIKPFESIYPWSREEYVLKYQGCANKGFKEAVQYLIDCINITPDSVPNIVTWKENINSLVKLRDAPTFTDPWTDIEESKKNFPDFIEANSKTTAQNCNIKGSRSSIRNVKYFDVQWSDCPLVIKEEVRNIWSTYDLGNDNYIYKCSLDEELFNEYPLIYLWLDFNGVEPDESVIIHYWW